MSAEIDWWLKHVPDAEVLSSRHATGQEYRCLRMRLQEAFSQPASDQLQLILGLSGEIRLTRHDCGFGNSPHVGKAGTFACIPGHAAFASEGWGDVEILVLTVPWSNVVRDAERVQARFVGDFRQMHRGSHQDSLISFLAWRLARCTPSDVLEADCLIAMLIRRLLLLAEPKEALGASAVGLDAKTLKRVMARIHESKQTRVRLDDLAEVAQMSKYHFLRSFNATIGMTPYQYVVRLRVGRARKMIEPGSELETVAVEAGFSDQSHLSRQFKSEFGMAPGSYRVATSFKTN